MPLARHCPAVTCNICQHLPTIEINVARSVLPIGPGILDIRALKEHILGRG